MIVGFGRVVFYWERVFWVIAIRRGNSGEVDEEIRRYAEENLEYYYFNFYIYNSMNYIKCIYLEKNQRKSRKTANDADNLEKIIRKSTHARQTL